LEDPAELTEDTEAGTELELPPDCGTITPAEEGEEEATMWPFEDLLGDVVISLPRAEAQAQEYGHSVEREVCYLTVHGVLHLVGYDHEDDADARKMTEMEESILTDLRLTR
ncbi:MAG: rRNA maturation RNase YbeY, partial [Firmicutes bacterium]|nr:rRNA maturation RNase YbeY [Bacillota bacterium]